LVLAIVIPGRRRIAAFGLPMTLAFAGDNDRLSVSRVRKKTFDSARSAEECPAEAAECAGAGRNPYGLRLCGMVADYGEFLTPGMSRLSSPAGA